MKNLKIFSILLVAIAFLAMGCNDQQVVDPTDNSVSAPNSGSLSKGKGPVVESVTGSGSFTTGAWRTFSFTARKYADGSVDGEWERINRGSGNAKENKSHGKVGCLTIVGNEAWIGMVATSGAYSDPGFNEGGVRLIDNGQGASSPPDKMSLQRVGQETGFAEWFCAATPETELYLLEAGNIQIKAGGL
jgi:hypothetical protein